MIDDYTERARVPADGSFDAARERLIALCRGAHQMGGPPLTHISEPTRPYSISYAVLRVKNT